MAVSARCAFVSGNFFEEVPPGADAYTMRHVLHDWSDDLCITILGNIRKVIPDDGRLLIIETVVPVGNEPSAYTIFNASGFRLTGITPTASPVSVIEARPV